MSTPANGLLPPSLLVDCSPPAGSRLRAGAAESLARVRAEVLRLHGWLPMPTSAMDCYRPYHIQERIFLQRYTTEWVTGIDPRWWRGRQWWRLPGTASAATPGRSNHGWGLAVDITGLGGFDSTRHAQWSAVAKAHGWSDSEGRSIREPWHWVYVGPADTVSNPGPSLPTVPTVPTPTTPTPIPEDIMATKAELADLLAPLTEQISNVAARVDADRRVTALYRLRDGGTAAWLLHEGVGREWIDGATHTAMGSPRILDIPASSPLWALPIIPGGGRVGELYRRVGDSTGAAWLVERGGRRHITAAEVATWAVKPTLRDLAATHEVWALPVIAG